MLTAAPRVGDGYLNAYQPGVVERRSTVALARRRRRARRRGRTTTPWSPATSARSSRLHTVQTYYARGIGMVAQQTTEVATSTSLVAGADAPDLSGRAPVCLSRARPTSVPRVSDRRPESSDLSAIIYTHTDEAPLLATYSFLPIIQAYAGQAGVAVETRDISLAGRIIAQFPERLTDEQRLDDALAELGELAQRPEANIIKLPNISASIPQLKAAIAELQSQGYDLPDYPDSPPSDEEEDVRARYDKVKGSAVNPVLREGNSDRRAAESVKGYARKHPHSMGAWSADSRTNVAHHGRRTTSGPARSPWCSTHDGKIRIEPSRGRRHHDRAQRGGPGPGGRDRRRDRACGSPPLREFLTEQIPRAQDDDVLFSVHLKATMMKVSDPIIFGHVVRAFFPRLFADYGEQLAAAGLSPNDGLGGILAGVESMDDGAAKEGIRAAIQAGFDEGPRSPWSTPTVASPTSTCPAT